MNDLEKCAAHALINVSRFRWVEVWLGVLFPYDPIALLRVAESKLEILESAQTLTQLGKEARLLNDAYQLLWRTNAKQDDESRRCHQIRMFQFVLGAWSPMTPEMLLEAIRFDPEQPANYSCELEINYIEKLYHNFLTVKDGVLVFEHVSAKAFILELDDQETKTPIFANGALNHGVIAKTSLLLLQKPKHTIWVGSKIDWDEYPRTLTQDKLQHLIRGDHWFELSKYRLMHRVNDRSLGSYVSRNWYRHCSHLRGSNLNLVLLQELSCLWLRIFADFPISLKCLTHPYEDSRVRSRMLRHSLVEVDNQVMVDPLMFSLNLGVFPFRRGDGLITDVAKTLENIMAQNLEGQTALHIAVQQDDLHSMEALLEISLQLNQGREFLMAQNLKGETALHTAVQQYDLRSVEALSKVSLEKGFEKGFLYDKEYDGRNALHGVKSDGVVRAILHFEAKIAPSPATPGAMSCQGRLLESEDDYSQSPMIKFMKHRSEELVLFTYGDQYVTLNLLPETRQIQLLGLATWRNFSKVTKLFLDEGVDINSMCSDQSTASMVAFLKDLFRKTQFASGAINGRFNTALEVAAWTGHLEIAKLLVERGADVNAMGGEYGTALMIAAFQNHMEVIRLLLKKGANANAVGGLYGTALGASISQNSDKPLFYLQMYHVDIDLAIRKWPGEGHWARSGQRCKPIADAWARYQANSGSPR